MFIEPVFGKKFFGREEVLGTLQKRVTSLKGGYRQNLALAGPMLTGKSSILRHFLEDIKDSTIIPLYIELSGEDFRVFSRRFMATLLYRYLKSEDYKVEGDFKDLKEACAKLIPETVSSMEQVDREIKSKKIDDAYKRLLNLTSIFKNETGKSCIVILDEFQNISNFQLKKPYQVFGKFIMVQTSTMYLVSSSQKTLLKEILSRKLSLLFGNFEVIEVNGFDNQTARTFISDKVDGLNPPESLKNYIIQMGEGNPFYLEVLANRFSSLAEKDNLKCETTKYMFDAFADVLYESSGVLNQYFTNNINFFLEKKSRKKYIPILVSLSHGNSTLKAIQKEMGKTDKDLSNKLEKLEEMDIVYKSGVFYKISDKLFEYWLKFVYSLKTRSMIDDMDIKYLEFRQAIDADYKAYCGFSKKTLQEVVSDLFETFNNEKVLIGMNARKLPLFDKVKRKTLSDNLFEVTGSVGEKTWKCHVKQGDITDERDISNLWTLKPNNGSSKIVRKVFIAINGIEQNAFLLAKEHSIWVWDVQQLNMVLRLFGKFELVL